MIVFTERRATRFQIYWLLHHFEQKDSDDGVKIKKYEQNIKI